MDKNFNGGCLLGVNGMSRGSQILFIWAGSVRLGGKPYRSIWAGSIFFFGQVQSILAGSHIVLAGLVHWRVQSYVLCFTVCRNSIGTDIQTLTFRF